MGEAALPHLDPFFSVADVDLPPGAADAGMATTVAATSSTAATKTRLTTDTNDMVLPLRGVSDTDRALMP